MLKAMIRDLVAHKSRVVMTLLAIAVGVAAMVAAWLISDSTATALSAQRSRTDVGIAVQRIDSDAALTVAQSKQLADLPGVRGVSVVAVGRAGLVGADGKLVPGETVPEYAGTNWSRTSRFELTEGRAPAKAGEVVLRDAEAAKGQLRVGTRVRILLADAKVDTPVVVGLFAYRSLGPRSDPQLGSDPVPAVAYDARTATKVLGDDVERIELTVVPGADSTALTAAADRITGPGFRASTGETLAAASAREAADGAKDLRLALLPAAAVALLVGMFVIANTFSILVTQRTRQFALLRAVGAYRRQIRFSTLVEALLLGSAGGAVGVACGIGLAALLLPLMNSDGRIPLAGVPVAVLLGLGIGLLVTVTAAWSAARRAAGISPMAALRLDHSTPRAQGRRQTIIGAVAVAVSVVVIGLTASPSAENAARIVSLLAALVGVVGVLLLAPVLAGFCLRPLLGLVARRSSPALRLAVRNAVRDPRRTAATGTAITIGLALICALGVLSATLLSLVGSTVRENVPAATTIVQPAAGGEAVLDASTLELVRRLPEVSTAAGSRDVVADISYRGGQTVRRVSAIEPHALGTVFTPDLVSGVADLRQGAVVSKNQADMLGLRLGDELTVTFDPAHQVVTKVAGIYDATELQAAIFVDVAAVPERTRSRLSLIYATGPDPVAAKAALDRTFAVRPDVEVIDRDALVTRLQDVQRVGFAVLYAMFAVAVIIAVFGVVNTLILSVTERTREIGIARAVGAGTDLIRRSIAWESLVISTFGAVLGVFVGLGVGAVLQHAMLGQHLADLTVPWLVIVLGLVGVIIAATAAAAWPAARAARTDPLRAIASG
ncbi:ABC transporter permease [Kribbella albertanoniae]|uniref:ABC transporter permease n=1 Tax=Kribbella albertanoniae TaxID=1266829 RepID=A0A4R4QF27_9ACTN|nr:ABC transporter permease [Kribbella albertanoniae]TDC34137.1 ABC transporter permease [Kribbella albertanoniae]